MSVAANKKYGFLQLDPLPNQQELNAFYSKAYADPLKKSEETAVDASAISEAEREFQWRQQTEYADLLHNLTDLAPGNRILDIGCGVGDFVEYLSANGMDATGIDPSHEAVRKAREQGRNVHEHTLERWSGYSEFKGVFDGVVLLNVLEHVSDPEDTLRTVRSLLKPSGVLVIRVPNDFSEVQQAAEASLKVGRWWVRRPDHVNYFSSETLGRLLKGVGFEPHVITCDFPIDWFLLMGDNYVADPAVGPHCHQRRRQFESSISGSLRRKIYRHLAAAGCGRNLIVHSRVPVSRVGPLVEL